MPKTALQIMQSAYATSRHNDAGRVADESGELLTILNRLLREYFAKGARVNRKWFGTISEVAFASGGWARPTTAEMIVRLEAGTGMQTAGAVAIAAGTEIADVPFDQRHIEPGKPAVYSFGQVWKPRSLLAPDPVVGSLSVFASAAPTELATTATQLPALWPESANGILIFELAIYLATKDGERESEVVAFTAERDKAEKQYLEFLEHESTTEVRSYGHDNRFNSPSVKPR